MASRVRAWPLAGSGGSPAASAARLSCLKQSSERPLIAAASQCAAVSSHEQTRGHLLQRVGNSKFATRMWTGTTRPFTKCRQASEHKIGMDKKL